MVIVQVPVPDPRCIVVPHVPVPEFSKCPMRSVLDHRASSSRLIRVHGDISDKRGKVPGTHSQAVMCWHGLYFLPICPSTRAFGLKRMK